jgi:cyclic pyranopterin phosphate synthase
MVDDSLGPVRAPSQRDLTDTLGRSMRDLRISVTDRCNFRCTFCMPVDGSYSFLPRQQILSFEEITRLVRIFRGFGVRKVRLTGGEPLLRSELGQLVGDLRRVEGLEDLALTTNGYLLPKHAEALALAGLSRVTVSFHSLEPKIFSRLNGLGIELQKVLDGLRAAQQAGLTPIKLNVVPIRGMNDHEVEAIARFARERGYLARFIEYMDVGTLNRWDPKGVVSAKEIIDRIDRVFPLEAVKRTRPGDVAERYRYLDGGGEIGVIPSVTQPFCADCTRVRLSAEGKLYTCLFSSVGHDLKTPMREGASDADLQQLIAGIWHQRTDRYSEERSSALAAGKFSPGKKVEMFRIGG